MLFTKNEWFSNQKDVLVFFPLKPLINLGGPIYSKWLKESLPFNSTSYTFNFKFTFFQINLSTPDQSSYRCRLIDWLNNPLAESIFSAS